MHLCIRLALGAGVVQTTTPGCRNRRHCNTLHCGERSICQMLHWKYQCLARHSNRNEHRQQIGNVVLSKRSYWARTGHANRMQNTRCTTEAKMATAYLTHLSQKSSIVKLSKLRLNGGLCSSEKNDVLRLLVDRQQHKESTAAGPRQNHWKL